MNDASLWYKDAVFYELHVRSFADSNADGIGDFPGLTSRLDYLQELGVNTLWLLPFYPSPLRDDGYDISDYTGIHPTYGTLAEFKAFLKEAHARGLRVVTELVLNHTSDQHPWFQRARRAAAGSRERDFYVWSDSPEKYRDARIIFRDFESSNWAWDPVAKAYYWHRFYSHQPDLNYDNPDVRKALLDVVDFWLEMGVDGLRLDAVPYLFEREGTSCENLPETHTALRDLRTHVDARFPGRMLLAEANQWPEDAVSYFGAGDECHMAFHFPIMPRMFMAIHMEDRFPLVDILRQTPPPPGPCQWALFLRNHDELTLEMVTDEERDYMYRVYALDPQARINLGIRRRLAPLLGNNRRKIELMNALLFSLPGTPVLYYGDEIGMGDNIYLGDRNGVRTPMQWSADKNAGFSRANPQRLYLPIIIDPEYHYEAVNVEAQHNNPQSLYWWMKRMIALNRRYKAFGRGSLEMLNPDNRKILTFIRRDGDEAILVVANLSRFVQYAEIDLARFRGHTPIELFGHAELPAIGERPYVLTLAPHGFYWFHLQAPVAEGAATGDVALLDVDGDWKNVFERPARRGLEDALPPYLATCRWMPTRGRRLKSASVVERIEVAHAVVTFVRVEFADGSIENYLLPLAFAAAEQAERLLRDTPRAVVARTRDGVLYDPLGEPDFSRALLDGIANQRTWRGRGGALSAVKTPAFETLRGTDDLDSAVLRTGRSNSTITFADRLLMRLFRRAHEGVSPDVEMTRFLTEKASFPNAPSVGGVLTYQPSGSAPVTVGVLQQFAVNQGDAWKFTLDQLDLFYERVRTAFADVKEVPVPTPAILDLIEQTPAPLVKEAVGAYLESVRQIGHRAAEMHLSLASVPDDPDFAPEAFTTHYQRSLYQSMRSLAVRVFELLRKRMGGLEAPVQSLAQRVLALEAPIVQVFSAVVKARISAARIRIHGNFHLEKVLTTGGDFVIVDFEGEPWRPVSERRIKRCALRDAAAMLRSLHYAASKGMEEQRKRGEITPDRLPVLERWTRSWQRWTSSAFLRAYLDRAGGAPFLPRERDELRLLLTIYLLEKAVHELGHELENRPEWAAIPLEAILAVMESPG